MKDIKSNIILSRINKENKEILNEKLLKKEFKNDKKIIEFNQLKDAQNFSSLINSIQSRKTSLGLANPAWSQSDTAGRWSPVSTAGEIYEWNRGVIGIDQAGITLKEKLDGTFNHHADATIRISSALGADITLSSSPFVAGVNAIGEGIIIVQTEGDSALVYLPDSITQKQLNSLRECLTPRIDFTFSLAHKGVVIDEVDMASIIAIASSIVVDVAEQNNARKR